MRRVKTQETRRFYLSTLVVGLVLSACGGGEMSMAEYVERVDAIFQRAIVQYEEVIASPGGLVLVVGQGEHLGFDDQGLQLTDFTPNDLAVALEQVARVQAEAMEAAAAIDPPRQIADIHALYFRELPLGGLAARAGPRRIGRSFPSPLRWWRIEMRSKQTTRCCADFQATLDATADRGVFADVPWMPSELSRMVDYALGCGGQPSNPQDAYRPPAP